MTEEEIVALLRAALDWAHPDAASIAESVDLDAVFSDLGIESLTLLQMAAYVEDRLGVTFSDERLMSMTTIRQFVDVIRDSREHDHA